MLISHSEMRDDDALSTSDEPNLSFLDDTLCHHGRTCTVDFARDDGGTGSLIWLGLIGPVLDTLANGTVLHVDELESSFHPSLVGQLVRTFQNAHSNPNGAQLIFNSFEAGLMGNSVDDRILGRDQVWFTEKLHDGG